MSGREHDVAVVGLGVMGSAAAYELAKRGLRVLGLERFHAGHDRGSSHGRTRVIRQAYFEHPDYVPLILRAYERWRALEMETGRELLRRTGALMIGPPESVIVSGSLSSARSHGLPHRWLTANEVQSEFPMLTPEPGEVALYEPAAGVLFAEEAVLAFQERARELGADLRFGEFVAPHERPARKTVVTTGPWMTDWMSDLPLTVERQVTYWLEPIELPLFIWDRGGRPFYGVPNVRGEGVKVAFHHGGETSTPDLVRREVQAEEMAEMRARLSKTVPGLNSLRRASTCLYTNTPDGHFAIGLSSNEVAVASACSGHGFKFAPVVGEILADLVVEGRSRIPIDLFRLDRFQGGEG